ncbi:hypothetical protein [Halobacillus hunanensis]|uniref:hypothetical protein n=1 Tax=Halobacillus hunanensis TaxID=578214 RepID=UPI001591229B|nr:hypothetical protein [Halobacillus hunanensis]
MQKKVSLAGWVLFIVGACFWIADVNLPFVDIDSVLVGAGAVLLLISGIMKMKEQQME